jgi:hypothetical protein
MYIINVYYKLIFGLIIIMTDIEITSDEMDQMIDIASKSKRIAKLTGKPDKRIITSKINSRKSEQAKLAKLKKLLLKIKC